MNKLKTINKNDNRRDKMKKNKRNYSYCTCNNNYNYQNYGVSGYEDTQTINNSMTGAVSTLILVGVAALIILVVVVSMFIMNGLEF